MRVEHECAPSLPRRSPMRRPIRLLSCAASLLLAGALLLTGCGGGSGGGDGVAQPTAPAPSTLTVAQGGSGTSAITVGRTNYTGAVTLALQGAPSNVTGAFSPAPVTGGTSTLTLTVGSGVAPGQYALTVAGTGASGPVVD